MNLEPVRRVADTLLYDGFNVFPYRKPPSPGQRRWRFGALYPRGYSTWAPAGVAYAQQTQCIIEGGSNAEAEVCVRFLQAVERDPGGWREAVEREVVVPAFTLEHACEAPLRQRFRFDEAGASERRLRHISGEVVIQAQRLGDGCHRLTVRAENRTPFNPARPWSEDAAALHALGAVHTVIAVRHGRLVSLIDPPAPHRIRAAECVNRGCFPVLVGDRDACDTLLASPTILPDYPDSPRLS